MEPPDIVTSSTNDNFKGKERIAASCSCWSARKLIAGIVGVLLTFTLFDFLAGVYTAAVVTIPAIVVGIQATAKPARAGLVSFLVFLPVSLIAILYDLRNGRSRHQDNRPAGLCSDVVILQSAFLAVVVLVVSVTIPFLSSTETKNQVKIKKEHRRRMLHTFSLGAFSVFATSAATTPSCLALKVTMSTLIAIGTLLWVWKKAGNAVAALVVYSFVSLLVVVSAAYNTKASISVVKAKYSTAMSTTPAPSSFTHPPPSNIDVIEVSLPDGLIPSRLLFADSNRYRTSTTVVGILMLLASIFMWVFTIYLLVTKIVRVYWKSKENEQNNDTSAARDCCDNKLDEASKTESDSLYQDPNWQDARVVNRENIAPYTALAYHFDTGSIPSSSIIILDHGAGLPTHVTNSPCRYDKRITSLPNDSKTEENANAWDATTAIHLRRNLQTDVTPKDNGPRGNRITAPCLSERRIRKAEDYGLGVILAETFRPEYLEVVVGTGDGRVQKDRSTDVNQLTDSHNLHNADPLTQKYHRVRIPTLIGTIKRETLRPTRILDPARLSFSCRGAHNSTVTDDFVLDASNKSNDNDYQTCVSVCNMDGLTVESNIAERECTTTSGSMERLLSLVRPLFPHEACQTAKANAAPRRRVFEFGNRTIEPPKTDGAIQQRQNAFHEGDVGTEVMAWQQTGGVPPMAPPPGEHSSYVHMRTHSHPPEEQTPDSRDSAPSYSLTINDVPFERALMLNQVNCNTEPLPTKVYCVKEDHYETNIESSISQSSPNHKKTKKHKRNKRLSRGL